MASYQRGQLEGEDDSDEDVGEGWGPMRVRGPGYTPFQFVPISDEQIKHEVRDWCSPARGDDSALLTCMVDLRDKHCLDSAPEHTQLASN